LYETGSDPHKNKQLYYMLFKPVKTVTELPNPAAEKDYCLRCYLIRLIRVNFYRKTKDDFY
jgi:hypothetical protein